MTSKIRSLTVPVSFSSLLLPISGSFVLSESGFCEGAGFCCCAQNAEPVACLISGASGFSCAGHDTTPQTQEAAAIMTNFDKLRKNLPATVTCHPAKVHFAKQAAPWQARI